MHQMGSTVQSAKAHGPPTLGTKPLFPKLETVLAFLQPLRTADSCETEVH